MGPGAGARDADLAAAYELGRLIAQAGWALVTGGRAAGVMEAASRGAHEAGGLTVGILPGDDASGASPFVHVPIVTGLGQARNNVNVLTACALVACGMGRAPPPRSPSPSKPASPSSSSTPAPRPKPSSSPSAAA